MYMKSAPTAGDKRIYAKTNRESVRNYARQWRDKSSRTCEELCTKKIRRQNNKCASFSIFMEYNEQVAVTIISLSWLFIMLSLFRKFSFSPTTTFPFLVREQISFYVEHQRDGDLKEHSLTSSSLLAVLTESIDCDNGWDCIGFCPI